VCCAPCNQKRSRISCCYRQMKYFRRILECGHPVEPKRLRAFFKERQTIIRSLEEMERLIGERVKGELRAVLLIEIQEVLAFLGEESVASR
jgi:hypothetical protein